MRPMQMPKGAKVHTRPLVTMDSEVPFRNPPPTKVAEKVYTSTWMNNHKEIMDCVNKISETYLTLWENQPLVLASYQPPAEDRS